MSQTIVTTQSQIKLKTQYKQKNAKTCPNPIFESWILEWKEEAVSKNSKMQYVYAKALSSLRKYPLPLASGKDCILLEYFGPSLCKQIDNRMLKEPHLFPQGFSNISSVISSDEVIITPKKRSKNKTSSSNSLVHDPEPDEPSPKKKSKTVKRSYVPAFRSGAYAILVTMFRKEEIPNYRGYMLKSEIINEAQEHCDSSFTKATAQKYTAWNSMASLISKDLVIKRGNPGKYVLTIEGRKLTAKMLNADLPSSQATISDSNSQEDTDIESSETQSTSTPFSRVTFLPNEFEIILCVDTSETNAKSKKDEVVGELRKNGVPLEVVRLSIGDFVWICRKGGESVSNRRRLTVSNAHDMILPYVVERKRADDLAHSIRDGRFHEQKHRLGQTGLQPIYLIEEYGTGDWGLADGALNQAIANTQIVNGFLVQETGSIKDTCAYLTFMTRHLSKIYKGKSVSNCTKEEWSSYKSKTDSVYLMAFNDFNEFGTKTRNWSVSEMFARHLMKLRGLSAERAFAIIERYPTVQSLVSAYRECESVKEKESMLSLIRYGNNAKTIGNSISKAIYSLYENKTLL